MAKDKTKQGSSKPISKGNEIRIDGANFCFAGDLYQAFLKILFLCFKNSDICQLKIDDDSNLSITSDIKQLFSLHCQKHITAGDNTHQDYMTLRQFREFFLLNSNLFKVLLDCTAIEVMIFKKPTSITELFDKKTAQPLNLWVKQIGDKLPIKAGEMATIDDIEKIAHNPFAALLPRLYQKNNWHFYPISGGGLGNVMALHLNKQTDGDDFDMTAISAKIAKIMSHDCLIYDDLEQE